MPPLTGEAFLLCLAQLGLAFGGFAGVIVALRREPDLHWKPKEVAGIKFIFEHAFGVTLYALLPFPLYYWLAWEQRVWEIGDTLFAIFLALLLFSQFLKRMDLTKVGDRPSHPKLLTCAYVIPTAALCLIESVKACKGSSLWYAIGLIYVLVQAVIQFWVFLVLYTQPKL